MTEWRLTCFKTKR